MNKIVPWVLFGVTAVGFAAYAIVQNNNDTGGGGAAVGNEAVAKVGDETITAQELYDQMVKQGGAQVVDSMIEQRLIKNEAESQNITVTDEDLDEALGKIKESFPSEEMFNQQLAAVGLTEEDLKKELVTEVELTKLLEPQIQVTDEDIKTYYEENKESFATPEQVRASHILVDTKEEAEEILAQLKAGADFAELAKEKSKDPGSAVNGGDLDYFGKGQMMPEFEEAAFNTPVGELSDIVQTSYGFHIIKVTDKKPAQTPTLEEKKEEIRETLFEQQKSEKIEPYIEELKGKTKTENYLKKA